jgi:uncharacterized protein DUF4390
MGPDMNRRLGCLAFVVAILSWSALVRGAESLRIVPLVSDDAVVVSFELADAYTLEIREAIASGLRTTFTYDVELRMVGTFWVDRTVASLAISTSDQYDNLTRRHSLLRTVDGRVAETLVTEDDSIVGKWLTTFTRLPLVGTSKLDSSREYYVRIRARSRPHGDSLLGWTNAITGQSKFTFIK